MKKTIVLSAAIIALSFACSTSKSVTTKTTVEPPTEDAVMAFAKAQWSDVTMAQLDEGKLIAETKCTRCHAQKSIPERSVEHWEKMIKVMAPKAKLIDSETEALRRYILTQKGLEAK